MAYLDDHPPRRSQFRRPRRDDPSGVIVVHTAENVPDTVAPDTGAEGVAAYISRRSTPGSYHELVDSNSYVNVVGWDAEAYHDGTGTNRHSMGLSFATQASKWPHMPEAWVAGAIEQGAQRAAAYARWVRSRYGITIPARHIDAPSARAKVPGFTSHGELDPGRRYDPGPAFPWGRFLNRYSQLVAGSAPTPNPQPDPPTQEDDEVPPYIIRLTSNSERWVIFPGSGFRTAVLGKYYDHWKFVCRGVEQAVEPGKNWSFFMDGFRDTAQLDFARYYAQVAAEQTKP